MKVTKPDITRADLYFSWTEPTRSQKNAVLAIMLASENDNTLYTRSNWEAFMSNMIVAALLSAHTEHN